MDDEDYLSDGGGEFEDLDFEAEKNDEYNEMGRQTEYRSKTFEEIVENFEEAVSHIEEACGVSADEAVPLLQYFLYLFCFLNSLCRWDKEKLLEAWFSDCECVAQKVGISLESKDDVGAGDEEMECPICMDTISLGNLNL
jgi:hypothetical protein